MANCPFYQVHMLRHAPDKAGQPEPIAWCSHAHSPALFRISPPATGEAAGLSCAGAPTRCEVAPEFRPPLWLTE